MEKIFKTFNFEIKEINREEQTLWAVGSTEDVDRDGDIIELAGWEIENYLKNPVIMWAHNYRQPPVGKALQVEPQSNGLWFHIKFAKTDFAKEIFGLYADQFMRAWSVGFQPKAEPIAILNEEGERTGRRYTQQELLELSAVPIPANQEALTMMMEKGLLGDPWEMSAEMKPVDVTENYIRIRVRDAGDFEDGSFRTISISAEQGIKAVIGRLKGQTKTSVQSYLFDKKKWTRERAIAWVREHGQSPKAEQEDIMDLEIKSVIPFRAFPKDNGDWNGPKEVAAAEVSDLKIMCTWYDSEKPDIKGSYKLPHHRASGHNSVWRGVAAAMAVLFGARGGANIPAGDRRGCYNHLAKEYKHHGKDPPEYKMLEILAGMLDEERSEAVEFVLLKVCGIDAELTFKSESDEQSAGLPPADAGQAGEPAAEEILPDDVAEELLEAVKGMKEVYR